MSETDDLEKDKGLGTRLLCQAYISFFDDKYRQHLISSRLKNFAQEVRDTRRSNANTEIKRRHSRLRITPATLTVDKVGTLDDIDSGDTKFGLFRSRSVQNIFGKGGNKVSSITLDLFKKASESSQKNTFHAVVQRKMNELKRLKLANEGIPQKELEKQRSADKQKKKVKLMKRLRRKSCYCSDCGGTSKFELKTMHINAPIKRRAGGTGLFVQRRTISSRGVLLAPSDPNLILAFSPRKSTLIVPGVSSPLVGRAVRRGSSLSGLVEARSMLSDRIFMSEEGMMRRANKGSTVIQSRPKNGDFIYKIRVYNPEEVDQLLHLRTNTDNSKSRFTTESDVADIMNDEPPEPSRSVERKKIVIKDIRSRQRSVGKQPVSSTLEKIYEKMRSTGIDIEWDDKQRTHRVKRSVGGSLPKKFPIENMMNKLEKELGNIKEKDLDQENMDSGMMPLDSKTSHSDAKERKAMFKPLLFQKPKPTEPPLSSEEEQKKFDTKSTGRQIARTVSDNAANGLLQTKETQTSKKPENKSKRIPKLKSLGASIGNFQPKISLNNLTSVRVTPSSSIPLERLGSIPVSVRESSLKNTERETPNTANTSRKAICLPLEKISGLPVILKNTTSRNTARESQGIGNEFQKTTRRQILKMYDSNPSLSRSSRTERINPTQTFTSERQGKSIEAKVKIESENAKESGEKIVNVVQDDEVDLQLKVRYEKMKKVYNQSVNPHRRTKHSVPSINREEVIKGWDLKGEYQSSEKMILF